MLAWDQSPFVLNFFVYLCVNVYDDVCVCVCVCVYVCVQQVSNPEGLTRQPFNAKNPNGPLELCCCKDCGTPIMLDDKVKKATPTSFGPKSI